MPKLDGNVAEQVDKAESGTQLIEEGLYEMVLIEVAATGKDGQPLVGKAGPYWSWTFAFPEDAERYAKRRAWRITSLSPDSAWVMKQMFDAFGVPADTDTDELIGKRAMVEIGHRTVTQGDNAGDIKETVKKVLPLDGVQAPSANGKAAAGGGTKGKKDLF